MYVALFSQELILRGGGEGGEGRRAGATFYYEETCCTHTSTASHATTLKNDKDREEAGRY